MSGYAELQVTSHFSFLRGASSCEELFAHAGLIGIEALAIVDRNGLAGIVRAHGAAKVTGVRLIVGCRLDLPFKRLLGKHCPTITLHRGVVRGQQLASQQTGGISPRVRNRAA